MFNMGPVWGLHYCVAPEHELGFEVYSECYRNYPDSEDFATYRNSCGFFATKEEADAARDKLNSLEN